MLGALAQASLIPWAIKGLVYEAELSKIFDSRQPLFVVTFPGFGLG